MFNTIGDRKEILKKKHQNAIKQLDALHAALTKLSHEYQASPHYPHVRLAAVRAFELAFHAIIGYVAERVGIIYEFEQPEYSAGQIIDKAQHDRLISREDHVNALEVIAVYSMTGDVYDGEVAEEICHDIDELFPVLCTLAQYTPEDINI